MKYSIHKIALATILVSGCASTTMSLTTDISPTASTPFVNIPITDTQIPAKYMPGTGRVEAVEAWQDRLKTKNYLSVYYGKSGTANGVPYVEDRSRGQVTRISVNKDWFVCEVVTTIPNDFDNWSQHGDVYRSGKIEAAVVSTGIKYTHNDYECEFQV